ncbi:hypothetical protein QMG25_14060 [Arthrobacter sp. H35-D1]|nr:hypothetical protein [Arthrobacter sp. H35-D1]
MTPPTSMTTRHRTRVAKASVQGPVGGPQRGHGRLVRAPGRLGDKLAALIGASPGEVVATDTTSLNPSKSLAANLRIQQAQEPACKVIVTVCV